MARIRSAEKRSAILQAAVREIARSGLGAPTAEIARRAGVAAGTLFTYFASKDELLNELYLELKTEIYSRINSGFPHTARLKGQMRHLWSTFLAWAIEFPDKRKVAVQLNLSEVITPETRARAESMRESVDRVFRDLEARATLRGLPAGFAAAGMSAMQEATLEFVGKQPHRRAALIERAFEAYWRAVR